MKDISNGTPMFFVRKRLDGQDVVAGVMSAYEIHDDQSTSYIAGLACEMEIWEITGYGESLNPCVYRGAWSTHDDPLRCEIRRASDDEVLSVWYAPDC